MLTFQAILSLYFLSLLQLDDYYQLDGYDHLISHPIKSYFEEILLLFS